MLTGCAVSDFQPRSNLVTTSTFFYDTLEQVQMICGYGHAGCYQCVKDTAVCTIHALKERCVVDHEMDHVYFGNFHGDEAVNCKARK